MGVRDPTRHYIADNEGLTLVHELIEYVETDTWKKIMDNMRRPPMVPDTYNAAQMIHQAAFVLSSKALGRLMIAMVAVLLFSMTYRPISADTNMYESRLKFFNVHVDDIKNKKNNDTNEPLKLSINIPIEEYIEGIDVYLGGIIGAINCPMSLVTRENMLATVADPPMAHNHLYSTEHGSVSEQMVQRYSHEHTLYLTDNATVYDFWDTALHGTKYHANIAPIKSRRDGRGAYLALNLQ